MSKILTASAFVLAAVHTASAQYNARILLPPSELPQGAFTHVYAMNESGQVFGEVVLSNADHRPVLWTDGVGVELPVPNGYYYHGGFDPTGYQFVNDSGVVVSRLRIANGVPNSNFDESRVVIWQNDVPQVLPMPDSCAQQDTGHQFAAPYGLNDLGHILVGTFGDNSCGKLWLWNGSGFQLVFDIADGATFNIGTPRLTHLNDADHVVIDRLPGGLSPTCDSNGTITGTLIGTEFTPITGGSALQINNHDHVLLYCTIGSETVVKLWDGVAVVDLGFGGAASMNELGQVVFLTGVGNDKVPKIYKDGVVSDLQLPMLPQTLGIDGGSLINSSGQIVISEVLMVPGGGVTDQAVMFTPRTPVITWPTPADITFGTALGPTQLNATANVPGTFAYTPASGTVLDSGSNQTLSVTFTPDDLSLYDQTISSVSINVLPASTTTTAFAFPTTAAFLQPVYLVATVASGVGVPGGVVQFTEGSTVVGSATLSSGTAILALNGIAPGAHSFTAIYQASSNFASSTFTPIAVTVQSVASSTFTLMFPLNNPQLAGQPASFAALVFALGGGTPTGTVQFTDGNTTIGSAALSGGVAVFTTNALASGLHAIGARYLGAGGHLPSASPVQLQAIYTGARPTATAVTLAASLSPSTLGQPVTFTATVTGGATAGEVYFLEDGFVLGHAPIADVGGSMKAAVSVPGLSVGTHIITALYFGSPGFAASSTGVPVVQVVQSGGALSEATVPSQVLEMIRSTRE